MNKSRALLLGMLCTGMVFAQGQTPQKEKTAVSQQAGDMELGIFTGAVMAPNGGGANVAVGTNFAYALNSVIYPYVEFSELVGALNSEVIAGNSRFVTSGNISDFHGGVHLRIPIHPRFVPYGVFAVGGFKPTSAKLEEFSQTSGNRISSQSVKQDGSFAINYGGGIRYYITNSIGVRFEVKAYGPTSKFGGGTPVRVAGGIFFQFKKK